MSPWRRTEVVWRLVLGVVGLYVTLMVLADGHYGWYGILLVFWCGSIVVELLGAWVSNIVVYSKDRESPGTERKP